MMRSVLVSIRPEWCEKILSGKKTAEIRKTVPDLKTPFKCYIYCTKPKRRWDRLWRAVSHFYCDIRSHNAGDRTVNEKVIAEFTCNNIDPVRFYYYDNLVDVVDCDTSCLSAAEILKYAGGQRPLYGWRISELRIYDTPKEISEFTGVKKRKNEIELYQIERPPQSWCYVEPLEKGK